MRIQEAQQHTDPTDFGTQVFKTNCGSATCQSCQGSLKTYVLTVKCSETELLEEFSVHILYILYNLALEMAEEGWLRHGNTYIVYSHCYFQMRKQNESLKYLWHCAPFKDLFLLWYGRKQYFYKCNLTLTKTLFILIIHYNKNYK